MKIKVFVLLLILRVSLVFACDLPGHFEFTVNNGDDVLYFGCYDAVNMGPHIIEYVLTKERADATGVKRPSVSFSQNRDGGVLQKLLSDNGYTLPHHNDYTRSGYDRGHMAPNADFNDTYENAVRTFFIANIWPQTPELNRVTWLKTENETRRLASLYMSVKVVIIVDEFTEKKVAKISVPACFKRRVYDVKTGELIYQIDVYQFEEYQPDAKQADTNQPE
jgi:DNA/RNA endonuclease G (NUC1)